MGHMIYYVEATRFFTLCAALIITYAYFNYTQFDNLKNSVFQRYSFIGIFIVTLVFFAVTFYSSIQPREWDFTCFYLIGKVAASGLDIYNPDHYFLVLRHADIPFELSADFKSEFLVTGCLYPPPTLFLFFPLGFMTYAHGLIFFYTLILVACIGCIYQLRETFFKNTGWQSWLMVCIIVMLTAPLYSVILYTQTLIFLLFFLILVYKNRERKMAGLYLALSIFIKPFTIVFILYFLIRKQWGIILSFVLSMVGIVLVTILIFGSQPFYEYFFHNPSQRIPYYIMFEGVNQSLLAVLTRALNNFQLAKTVYYTISFVLVVFSGVLILFQIKNKRIYDIFFPLLLSGCLIIYPNTLYHYAVVQLLSLMIILVHLKKINLKYLFLILFFVILYGRIFYLNVFLFMVSTLLILEDQIKKIIDRRKIYSGSV